MEYLVTERLVVDDEVKFGADIDRCVALINQHQSVAVGTFKEAEKVLLLLGITEEGVFDLMGRALDASDMAALLPSDGGKYALPR
jgi:hypothetical protein